MKHALVIALLFISFSASSQFGWRLGAKGGIGYTVLLNSELQNDLNYLYAPSFAGHGGISVGFNHKFLNIGFTLGLFYTQYNQVWNNNEPIINYERELKFKYFNIPFLLRIRPAGDRIRKDHTFGGAYFEIGINPSFLLGTSDSRRIDSIPDLNYVNVDVKTGAESFNIGAVVGFGLHQVGTRRISLTHGIRFSYNFLNVINDNSLIEFNGGDSKLLSAAYIIGLSYKFGRAY